VKRLTAYTIVPLLLLGITKTALLMLPARLVISVASPHLRILDPLCVLNLPLVIGRIVHVLIQLDDLLFHQQNIGTHPFKVIMKAVILFLAVRPAEDTIADLYVLDEPHKPIMQVGLAVVINGLGVIPPGMLVPKRNLALQTE
jgi:hypothetical protein